MMESGALVASGPRISDASHCTMPSGFGQRIASWFGRSAEPREEQSHARLVVGLGNPGREYSGTRHNIGFEVIDRLAEKLGWSTAAEFDRVARGKFDGLMLEGPLAAGQGQIKLVLLKPTTFMNLSGQAVQKAARFYKLSSSELLVVLDDLALPVGKLRLRKSGSDGGHNGLRDIERALSTRHYARLRIGVDPPPEGIEGKQYVLGRFTTEQRRAIEDTLPNAVECCLNWASEGAEAAMNRFNSAGTGAGAKELRG